MLRVVARASTSAGPRAICRGLCSYPLHTASEAGDLTEVTRLIDAGHSVNAGDPKRNGTTALHLSIRKGHRDVAELLLRAGADPLKPGAWKFTPLMYAAIWGQPELAQLLVETGAAGREALLVRDARGDTALDHAVGERKWEVAKILVRELRSSGCLGGADPALDALAARVREDDPAGAEAATGGRKLTIAEAFRRNSELIKERKAKAADRK